MEVGDKVNEWVHFGETHAQRRTGTVTYIHPKRRFYTVRFDTEIGSYSESYFFPAHGRVAADARQ